MFISDGTAPSAAPAVGPPPEPDVLGRIGLALTGEIELPRLLQRITDEATLAVGAEFGAFFYNVEAGAEESYLLYTISGVPREAFSRFPMPRNTDVFAPTFRGEGTVRSDDIRKDPRYGRNAPYHGMPEGHLPVVSYLAAPVKARSGEVVGGLFFGHKEPGRFTERDERVLEGIAPWAAIAVINARLVERLRRQEHAAEERARERDVAAKVAGLFAHAAQPGELALFERCAAQLLELPGVQAAAIVSFGDSGIAVRGCTDERLWALLAGRETELRALAERRDTARLDATPTPVSSLPLYASDHALGALVLASEAAPADLAARFGPIADLVALAIERKREAWRLARSETMHRLVAEAADEGIWIWEIGPNTVEWNDRLLELMGVTRASWGGRFEDWFERLHPDDKPRLSRALEEHLAGRAPYDVPRFRIRHQDGTYRICRTRGRLERAPDGTPLRMAGNTADITDEVLIEERDRLIAEAASTLGSSIDYQTTLQHVAEIVVPRFADWFAIDELRPDGSIERVTVHHVDPAKVERVYDLERRYPSPRDGPHGVPAVLRTGKPDWMPEIPDALLEVGAQSPEHLEAVRELGLRSYIVVPLSAHGALLGALTLVSAESGRLYREADVETAVRLAERIAIAMENAHLFRRAQAALAERDEALARLSRFDVELERRVRERTAELEEVNRELESFSYTVSHDLRAPVRHVAGFADLLATHAGAVLDEKGKRLLGTIREASQQMGVLIDALLAFSRISRHEMGRVRVPLDLVVEKVLKELEPDLAERRVELQIAPLPAVVGDPTMLRIVLTNLLANAIKYTRGRDPARISVRWEREGAFCAISITDNGIGFDMAYARKLFGVFSRLHNDPSYEGTGIGLATVRRIVERHGGQVRAQGRPGEGSTFSIVLPMASEAGTQ